MRIVKVRWQDSCSLHGWNDVDDARTWYEDEQADIMESVGYVVTNTHEYIVLAQSRHGESHYGNLLKLSYNIILGIDELENPVLQHVAEQPNA